MERRTQNLNRNRSKSFSKDGDNKLSRSPEKASRQKERRALTMKGCETIREMVMCSICLEKLRKPKMLPCQHTFCLLCLQNCSNCDKSEVLSENSKKICCPQCRNSTAIPSDGLSSLPSNIYLQSLLDLIESDNLEKEVIRCSSCQTVCVDTTPCHHCELVFCSLCQNSHIEKLRLIVEQIANQLESSSKQLLQRSKLIDIECNGLKSQIKTETQIKIQKMKDIEESLLETVTEEAERESEDIHLMTKNMNSTASTIRTVFQDEFDRLSSSAEKVKLFLNMHKKATDLLEHMPKLGQLKLLFDPDHFNITVERKICSDNQACNENFASTSNNLSTNDRDSPDGSSQDSHSRFYRTKSFSDRIKIGFGIVQRPAGISVCPWSKEIYVVSMDSHKVNVFDCSGRFHRSFGSRGQNPGEFLCPFGIAFSVCDKRIIISDKWKNCLNIYDEEGTFLKQIGLKGRSPGHFRSPEGVATDKNGKIYVCDTGNDRVQVLDSDGAVLFEVGVKNIIEGGVSRQKSIFNEPTGIAVTPDGNSIIVCDFGHHKVRIFNVTSPSAQSNSWSAELTLTLGTKGQLKGQFSTPECVAVDNQGFILIGDSGNGRIQICRPDGKVVRMFGNLKGHSSGHFSWISGIAVTDDYDIIVSDFKNHCVKMF